MLAPRIFAKNASSLVMHSLPLLPGERMIRGHVEQQALGLVLSWLRRHLSGFDPPNLSPIHCVTVR